MTTIDSVQSVDLMSKFVSDFTDFVNSTYDTGQSNQKREKGSENSQKINLNEKDLKKLEKAFNNTAASLNFDLKFKIHKDTGEVQVKIIDKNTHKVIKEIPSESFLNFLKKFDEMLGVLFDKKS